MVEKTREARASDRVQSLDRAFTLLERLADAGRPVTISDLADASELPMPTIHRLLRFLTNEGYVRQDASRRYALGLRLIRLGHVASRGLDTWAHEELQELADEFGETANVALLQGDACIYVAQVPSPRSVRMFTEVGRVVSPHCTGVGKAMMSTLSEANALALLNRIPMPAMTPTTITTPAAMMTELAVIRERGYAVDEGEQEVGVRCVAVPIAGLPIRAAISVSGPSSRVTPEQVEEIAPVLIAAAARLRRRFPDTDSRAVEVD